ncbi:PREDICTED: uncharacterized protein LOC105559914 [Vollenhovia emeryi]|uniref:uncharacterized protein LOC105559914 n=1 Tax=Vollenhovia emeryi TaxID=411798 RepID=UPI0005F410C1|nr:PREDICTED: uncharacterized protein LOC105559914 [Vollenhovia emeryi]
MTGGKPSSSTYLALFAVVVVLCHFDRYARACTPAVIWCPHESPDYETAHRASPSSPLQKLTSEEFESSLAQFNVTEPVLVVEELCVEDLRNSKVLSNTTNGSKIFYFPCVITPDAVSRKVYKEIRTVEDINDDHEFNMALKDVDSSGCMMLTGKQCRYSYTERIKRDAPEDNSTEFKIKTDRVIMYSAQPLTFKLSENSEEVKLGPSKFSGASDYTDKDKNVTLTLRFTNVENIGSLTLEFLFAIRSIGYYTLNRVNYEINNERYKLYTRRAISFPFNFSYHCSPKTAFVNGSTYLNIADMQVQIDPKNATFSDAYDCVGFTSIPIWTGIFVTAILGVIMIWALTMIMDIRTMDRFDDPKGKTITISSAE